MNYPIWDVPSAGLLIALVAIVHVFVSHFAVGGGLFLVVTERKARGEGDADLLGYVERHTRFFVLLTLVFGAVTGVGIWFTIGLVHPSATSALIQIFVWFWAIEWTFFATEIAAALVYYYGWHRLTPAAHEQVGWVYVVSAWMSLVVINGILTFMLTPGAWLETGNVWAAFFNPTYWPALVARTFASVGLAGIYALFTASWMTSGPLKARLARYAALKWVLPMGVAVPLSLLWYLWAAASVGTDVAGLFGTSDASFAGAWHALVSGSTTGYPVVRAAAATSLLAGVLLVTLVAAGVLVRPSSFGAATTLPVMLCGLVMFGGVEFVREGLRKPYVLGQFMFVNGVRLPLPWAEDGRPAEARPDDAFTADRLNASGVLVAAKYVRPRTEGLAADDAVGRQEARGRAVFTLLCASCHTLDGYLAIRPLVRGRQAAALDGVIDKLALPVDAAAQPSSWSAPRVRLATWRDRHMPPFVGTPEERRDLAVYLALLGGAARDTVAASADGNAGKTYFDEHCAMCHSADGEWAFEKRPARDAKAFYEMLGRLPEINEMMPAFEGNGEQRRAVAAHLEALTAASGQKEKK